MPNDQVPLFVRLSTDPSRRLERAVSLSGKTKRQLVEEAVSQHLNDDGFVVGRVALREEIPEIMTLAEAAALLRVEQADLEEAARGGEVPARQIAGTLRFSRAALLKWFERAS